MQKLSLSGKLTTPKYEQLAAQLRRRIEGGELKSADRLPTFSEMRAQLGVSQATLDRAYGLLEQEGLVMRQQGRGTFVAQTRAAVASAQSQANGWLQDSIAVLTRHGQEAQQRNSGEETRHRGSLIYITRGVVDAIEEAGLHTLMLNPDRLASRQIEQLTQSHPHGLIVTDTKEHTPVMLELVEKIKAEGVPVVCYGGAPELAVYDRVTSDHEQGSYELTRWLIEQGRRRIVPVWGLPATGYWLPQRRAGYQRAMEESGLETWPTLIVPGFKLTPLDHEDFEQRVRKVAAYLIEHLTSATPPDALLLDTDATAFYVAAALRLFHLEPNRDIALAGYDNYWNGCAEQSYEPVGPLVSMDKLNDQAGCELVKLLEERAAGGLAPAPQNRVLAPRLVVTSEAALSDETVQHRGDSNAGILEPLLQTSTGEPEVRSLMV